jgi:L-threonylcarbamoyladenylate synthase
MQISLSEAALRVLREEVVAVPTETVYGLASLYQSQEGIKKIFSLKNRPLNNPLIVHVSSLKQLESLVTPLNSEALRLIEAFWPGPLTLILPLRENHGCHKLVTAGLSTVAVRMPAHKKTLELIDQTGPIVAPSANQSGYPSSTLREHVEKDFGEAFPVLEGVIPSFGLESTILAYQQGAWVIAREGALTPSDFAKVLGYTPCHFQSKGEPICPGTHYKHYSPLAKLKLKSYQELQECEEIILGYTDRTYPKAKKVFFLGSIQDPASIQQNLYSTLRSLDLEAIKTAFIDIELPSDERLDIIKRRIEKAALS